MIDKETKHKLILELEKPYYSIYETAEILGVHHKTIRYHINNGTLRAGKLKQYWRISKEDIIAFLEAEGATQRIRKDINLTDAEIKILQKLTADQIGRDDQDEKYLLKLNRINTKLKRSLGK